MADIKTEITTHVVGPTDFVVIATDRPLKSFYEHELMRNLADQLGLPHKRILLLQPGMTISVMPAKEAAELLVAARQPAPAE